MNDTSLNYSVVGFLDILGFSSMVEEDSNGAEPKYLPVFLDVFEELAASIGNGGPDVKMFSDSIIIAAPFDPENVVGVLKVAAAMQRLFVRRNVLIRGGVAFGKHFSNANVTFSQALVNAYLIESKVARFPRIVVDEGVLNFAWHHSETSDLIREEIRKAVIMDRDGAMFINYLDEENLADLTPDIRAYIEENLSRRETILEKMRWLLDYHNHCANVFGTELLSIQNLVNGFSKIETIA